MDKLNVQKKATAKPQVMTEVKVKSALGVKVSVLIMMFGALCLGIAIATMPFAGGQSMPEYPWICGDLNYSHQVDGADVTYFVRWAKELNSAPRRQWVADVNGDGLVTGADIKYLTDYLKNNGTTLRCNPAAVVATFKCGNANGDNLLDLSDVTYLKNYLTNNGPTPFPVRIADVNNDGQVNADDQTILVDYFKGSGAVLNCPQ